MKLTVFRHMGCSIRSLDFVLSFPCTTHGTGVPHALLSTPARPVEALQPAPDTSATRTFCITLDFVSPAVDAGCLDPLAMRPPFSGDICAVYAYFFAELAWPAVFALSLFFFGWLVRRNVSAWCDG